MEVITSSFRSKNTVKNEVSSLTDWNILTNIFGTRSSSGVDVTDKKVLKLSAVWACTRLISSAVAGLPFNLYQRLPDESRKRARGNTVDYLIHTSPNAGMTAYHFWQAYLMSMLLWGNGYAEIKRNGNKLVSLEFLYPRRMQLTYDDNDNLIYTYSSRNGTQRVIPSKDILHTPAFSLDGKVGMSAIAYGAEIFGSATSTNDAANSTFKNGMMPTVAFKVDRVMNKDQRDKFREYVTTVSGALNAGKSPVLEQGVTPEMIGINPVDAQLLESRSFSNNEICSWFGVQPWMIGLTDKSSNWGTGLEQQMIAFLTFCISSHTNAIQQQVNKTLLTPTESLTLYAEFALEGFLKADSAARATFYSQMITHGIYTPNEVRVKENLPKMKGNADELFIQSGTVPLNSLGKENNDNS